MFEYALLIVAAPLVAFLLIIIFGRWTRQGGAAIAIAALGTSFIVSVILFAQVLGLGALGAPVSEEVFKYNWIGPIEFGLLIDNVSALMMVLVSFLCLIIGIYSLGYMAEDKSKTRYYAEFVLFTAGMLGTVSANNFLQFLIFWETMGLCSYLLIGFWYEKSEAASAAKKAFMVTRVGDMLLLIGIMAIFASLGTFNIVEIQARGIPAGALMHVIPLLLFAGAVGKSAQFPLHIWLPDAMEGPTTVSALIHAATMVKAGVFLVARSFPLVAASDIASITVICIGGFTAIFAASMALVAFDIKRVLAYSTISQIGYMILGLGAAALLFEAGHASHGFTASMYHLMNHAFFKALLFLAAGSVIHAVGTNDMRVMGGLHSKMKITSIAMLFGALALSGIPPFSGFWSKDAILHEVFVAGEMYGAIFTFIWVAGVITAFLTAFYAFRLWFMTFAGKTRGDIHPHESPRVMTYPLIALAVFALISGMLAVVIGGFGHLVTFGGTVHEGTMELLTEIFTSPLTYITLFAAVAGIGLAYIVYCKQRVSSEIFVSTSVGRGMQKLLQNRYYLDAAYRGFALHVGMGIARAADWFDRNVIDGVVNGSAKLGLLVARGSDAVDRKGVDGAVDGIAYVVTGSSNRARARQTGQIQAYIAAMVMGMFVVALIMLIYLSGGW
ncbi:MAG: NADH-quinone oxidoreductase subunit L [Thermoplasmata archaeon]|nr:NADH-quinone oxidoreductase subunit L [Thermoplasmata archaeon]